jgi:hypothetical protein
VAKALHDLAETYRRSGRFGEAEPLYQRAMQTVTKRLGPEHPDVTTCMLSYARLLQDTGRKREAKRLQKEAHRRARAEEDPSRFVVDVRDLLRNGMHTRGQ